MPDTGIGENGVRDGLLSGLRSDTSRRCLVFEDGWSFVIDGRPVGPGDTLVLDGDFEMNLPTLVPLRTPEPALGRPRFLGSSALTALILAFRLERRLDVSCSSSLDGSSSLIFRGVGGGGDRLGDIEMLRGGLRGLDRGLWSRFSSPLALGSDVKSTSGLNGPGRGDKIFGELGRSAETEAWEGTSNESVPNWICSQDKTHDIVHLGQIVHSSESAPYFRKRNEESANFMYHALQRYDPKVLVSAD